MGRVKGVHIWIFINIFLVFHFFCLICVGFIYYIILYPCTLFFVLFVFFFFIHYCMTDHIHTLILDVECVTLSYFSFGIKIWCCLLRLNHQQYWCHTKSTNVTLKSNWRCTKVVFDESVQIQKSGFIKIT